MAKDNKKFLDATGTKVLAHSIKHDKSNSVMRARSSDHGSLDGLNDILSIIDELHAVNQKLYDVVVSGLKKRKDSLLLCITTAGNDTDGVGYAQSVYSKKICLGDVEDDQTFAIIYTVDENDDVFEETSWKKANPNYGVSVDPIAMTSTATKSKTVPSELANFKIKNLNIWTSELNAFFDARKWDACADPDLSLEQFKGEKCKIGVDLASRIDIATFVMVFKRDDTFYLFDSSYIPEDTVKDVNSTLYNDCIAKGYLNMTPGEAINQDIIRDDIKKASKTFKIDEAMFDIWNASGLMTQLSQERIECVEFRMTTANLSEPMKTLDELIRKGNIRHNGSPLFRFCINNVVAKADANDNVFPRKSSEKLKIDLAVAAMMALAGWIQDAKKKSIYESENRGLRVL
jgi:phage terminase large subunit-like protein